MFSPYFEENVYKRPLYTPRREGLDIMTKVVVENIVASAVISAGFKVDQLAEKVINFKYSPDEFEGLTMKLDDPKTAILLFPSGKVICTGAKTLDEVDESIKKTISNIRAVSYTHLTLPTN